MAVIDDDRRGRPDPEALLRAAEPRGGEGRGRLKVFLGYGPGVGKSFRLFDEGRRRRERGQDVVVAATLAEMPPDAARVAEELESIPTRQVGGVPVLDVERLLERRPSVCLVDGLAFDHPPGARHARRYEDVDELLAAGISVLASVSLEHIAEQVELVRRVVGVAPAQTVPQAFLNAADEVVVVDAPPTAEGWSTEALSALRQQALLLTAQVVDLQLEGYLEREGVQSTWGTQERILVCMTPRANASAMLVAARQNVDRFHGELYAVYVVQPNLTDDDRAANERNVALARAQRANVAVLEGKDPVATILDFAGRHHVTQLFVGHTRRTGWRARWFGTPLDRLVREAHRIDVRVFPQ